MNIGDTVFAKDKNQILECVIKDYNDISGIFRVSYRNGLIELLRSESRLWASVEDAENF